MMRLMLTLLLFFPTLGGWFSSNKPKWIPLRMLSLNTRLGHAITNGVLFGLVRDLKPHVVFLQEVHPNQIRDLKRVMGPKWVVYGNGDSMLCLRIWRFKPDWWRSPENSKGEMNKPRTAPAIRHATQVGSYDRRTRRPLSVGSLHCQPLGKGLIHATEGARRIQTNQLEVFAKHSAKQTADAVVVDAGDVNQDVSVLPWELPKDLRDNSVHTIFGAVTSHRQVAAFRWPGFLGRSPFLDEFFIRTNAFTKVVEVRNIELTNKHPDLDHDARYCELSILRAPK